MSAYRKKIFPIRLPQNYHGPRKDSRRMSQLCQQKSSHKQANPQLINPKIVNWQIKRNNKFVTQERRQYLAHTGKISHDTPFWFQTTSNFYRKEQAIAIKKNPLAGNNITKQQKNYDVFNRRRMSLSDRLDIKMDQTLQSKRNSSIQKKNSWNVTQKVGSDSYYPRLTSSCRTNGFFNNDVAGKIGSVQQRDYSVKKPQLKIGKTQCINTYSPF